MGIAVTGSGVGMFVVAPLAQFMINNWGWRHSLRGLAIMVILGGSFAALFKSVPTKKVSESSSGSRKGYGSMITCSHVISSARSPTGVKPDLRDEPSLDNSKTSTNNLPPELKISEISLSSSKSEKGPQSGSSSGKMLKGKNLLAPKRCSSPVTSTSDILSRADLFYSISANHNEHAFNHVTFVNWTTLRPPEFTIGCYIHSSNNSLKK